VNQQRSSDPVRDALGGSLSARGKTDPNRQLKVLTDELQRAANAIIAKYPNSRSATLPLLFLAQAKEGYLTEEGMRDVAQLLGLTPADVLASASFYTMFKRRGQGRYLISVCRNISCTHLGSRKVVAALSDRLGVEPGGTTPDGLFSLESAECLGTCDGAPAMQINYEDFYRMTPEEAVALVDRLALGEEVRGVRGQPVQTSREIAYEIAVTGAYRPQRSKDTSSASRGPAPTAPQQEALEQLSLEDDEKDALPDPIEDAPDSASAQAEGLSTLVEDVADAREEERVVPADERDEQARLIGGVTLPPDLAPGWRPRAQPTGEDESGGEDA
jgi:NADH-quinone oxidoreductase subunit E